LQTVKDEVRSSVRGPITEGPLSFRLPAIADRANKFAYFDTLGNLTAGMPIGDSAMISAAMNPVVSSSTLEIARAQMAQGTEMGPVLNAATLAAAREAMGPWVDVNHRLDIIDHGADPTGTTDSTAAIQVAIDLANPTPLSTHTVSDIKVVWVPDGTYRVDGQLVMREGVFLVGSGVTAARLQFGWTGGTSKIIGYGQKYDVLQSNPPGTTFTKNWGLQNITLMPSYTESGPGSCAYIDSLFDIELTLINVRIIMHKGAVGGGQLNAIGLRLEKSIDLKMYGVTFDGGTDHISAAGASSFGMTNAICTGVFSYCPKNHSLYMTSDSNYNSIDICIQHDSGVGSNRGILLESGTGNRLHIHAFGAILKTGAIVRGTSNILSGFVKDAATTGVSIEGDDCSFYGRTENCGVTDLGAGSVISSPDYARGAGRIVVPIDNKVNSTVSTWQDIASITFPTGVFKTCTVWVDVHGEIAGVGRESYSNQFAISQNSSGTIVVTAGTPFLVGTHIEAQFVSVVARIAKLQVRFVTLGTSFSYSADMEVHGDRTVLAKTL
jgi:hypothetical protein